LGGEIGPKYIRDDGPFTAHTDLEMIWLETIVEVVAALIEKFPQVAVAATDAELDVTERLAKMDYGMMLVV